MVDARGAIGDILDGTDPYHARHLFRRLVRYQYRDSAGQSHEGTSEHMLADKANAWNLGDRIPIRYDPNRPHLSVWTWSHHG